MNHLLQHWNYVALYDCRVAKSLKDVSLSIVIGNQIIHIFVPWNPELCVEYFLLLLFYYHYYSVFG